MYCISICARAFKKLENPFKSVFVGFLSAWASAFMNVKNKSIQTCL